MQAMRVCLGSLLSAPSFVPSEEAMAGGPLGQLGPGGGRWLRLGAVTIQLPMSRAWFTVHPGGGPSHWGEGLV